ncbi:hypothetical protein NDU88_003779, partial [Pleurodeles waltl]
LLPRRRTGSGRRSLGTTLGSPRLLPSDCNLGSPAPHDALRWHLTGCTPLCPRGSDRQLQTTSSNKRLKSDPSHKPTIWRHTMLVLFSLKNVLIDGRS